MSITRLTYTYKKPHLRYDSKAKEWIGYRIDIKVGGKRYRNTFGTRGEAETFIHTVKTQGVYARAGLRAPRNANSITIKALIDARLETRTRRKQREFESRVFEYFLRIVTPTMPVTQVGVQELREFVRTRAKDKTVRGTTIAIQTVDRELTAIAAMLHAAGEYFNELENYTAPKIPHPKFPKSRRERVITSAERDRLLDALRAEHPDIADIFEFASLTGLRHTEIMRLRKTNFDRPGRSLTVKRLKTDSTSTLAPLTDRMIELLENDRFDGPFVFTSNGKTPSRFYRWLKEACEVAGIKYGRFEPDGVILHDARHTFVTTLQQAGIDLATIQSFSGHSDKELVMRYSHARPESRKRAMAVLDGRLDVTFQMREIYDNVRDGKMSFEEFLEALK